METKEETKGSVCTEIVPAHTPGPWVAREQFTSTRGFIERKSLGWIVEHENGRIGWSSYATAEPNEGEGPPYTISAANARLIAAAPSLLNAAEKARWALTAMIDLHKPDPAGMALIALNELDTALALATSPHPPATGEG